MNDLDLRTALHRDADLVGAPSPDLLEQLGQRRQQQSRQRGGIAAAVLGVVAIAAGIPIGQSLMTRADVGPATEVTPTVATEVSSAPATPTPTVTAPTSVVPAQTSAADSSAAAEAAASAAAAAEAAAAEAAAAQAAASEAAASEAAASEAAASEAAAAAAPPSCPDTETLVGLMPAEPNGGWWVSGNELNPPRTPQCSGDFAVTTVFHAYYETPGGIINGVPVQPGDVGLTGGVALFQYMDGTWTWLDRTAACDAGSVPDELHYWTCETS
jgi:hypothetical protein